MPHITIYSTTWCSFCKAEKRFLTEHNLPYQDINVETDDQAAQTMFQLSGQTGVPFTVITKDDGAQVGILGFDQPRLAHELGITQKMAHPSSE